MGSFVPGEVKIFSRIKLPPPLPRSRDFLPSGGRFENGGRFEKISVATLWMGRKKISLAGGKFFYFVG